MTAGRSSRSGQDRDGRSATSFPSWTSPASARSLSADVVEVPSRWLRMATLRQPASSARAARQLPGDRNRGGSRRTAHTFKINALPWTYSTAMLNDFTSGAPANGDVVEVKGTVFDSATTKLTASASEPADDETRDADHGDEIEREGLITRFVSATDFDVGGQARDDRRVDNVRRRVRVQRTSALRRGAGPPRRDARLFERCRRVGRHGLARHGRSPSLKRSA